MNLKILAGLTLAMLATTPAVEADFDVTAIGVRGGLDDGNLSAWMIAPQEQARGVMCDAGTLVNGMETARHLATLQRSLDTTLHNDIAGYLISHAHLGPRRRHVDRLAGG
ncbi:hypothetical protein KRR38_30310 [Novosphingobium sp. G106]|uniref:hypothetical protein n=1 Tax=Novosphingobium sp. G106 TaxID=2849500 RepID=UPI001C2DC23C|nr:hypothetical protein [Novosphingobium sp. G106]MBV1691848.1 hypothetical protein [Novosphingobium sp. G106]